MSSKPVARRFVAEDLPAVAELVNRIHGVSRSLEHFRWKYLEHPAGPPLSAVAERDGAIIGHLGGQPASFLANGHRRKAVQELDIFVDEEHRSMRTFFELYRKRVEINIEEGVEFSFGVTIERTSKVGLKAMRLTRIGAVPRLVRPLDYRESLAKRIKTPLIWKPLAFVANAFLGKRHTRGRAVPENCRLLTIDRFDERSDRLWEAIAAQQQFVAQVKNAGYLNWRYVDIPDVDYERLGVEADTGELLAIAVLGRSARDERRFRIFDFLTGDASSAASEYLLVECLRRCCEGDAQTVAAWAFPDDPLHGVFRRFGFRLRETPGTDLIFRPVAIDDPPVEIAEIETSPWRIAAGDSDAY